VVSNFYRDDEIVTAKQLLIQNVDTSLHASIQPYAHKRIGDNKTERSVEDILNVINIIDEHYSWDSLSVFCALSMMPLPTMPDDMSDLAVIRSELSDLRRQFNDLLNTVTSSATLPPASHMMQPHASSQVDAQHIHVSSPPVGPLAMLPVTAHEMQTDAENEDITLLIVTISFE